MKKIFAVGMSALLLAGACGLSACGGNKVAVDVRGKEYTFSSTETWSYYYLHSDAKETPIDDPEQWLADNWNLLSDEYDKVDIATGLQRTPAQLIERYKAILFNGNTGFLKGATVTISETTRTEGKTFYCNATVFLDGQTLAAGEVFGDYSEYYKGYGVVNNQMNGTDDHIVISVKDYDAKTGKINEVVATVSKPLGNGGDFIYHNNISTSVNLTKSGEYFCLRCEYKLVSVTDLT